MWGNVYGWIIAAVLGLLMSLGLWQLGASNRTTPPTSMGLDENLLKPLTFEITPNMIVQMTTPGDACDLYRLAIAEVNTKSAQYEAFLENGTEATAKQLSGIKNVIDATPLATMTLLSRNPEANVGYFDGAVSPDLAAIEKVGLAIERLGLLHFKKKDYAQSKRHFLAQFALGTKLFGERVTYKQAEKGIGLMRASVAMLGQIARIENNTSRVEELARFDASVASVFDRMRPMWTMLYSVDNRVIARHAGDVFVFASPAQQERMWRVEAILKLGRFRYNVGGADARMPDQKIASQRLAELATETDPVILAAVKAAQSLTLQQFRMIQ